MLCNYCGKETTLDGYGEYCAACWCYQNDSIVQRMKESTSIAPGEDAILSLDLSLHEHDDEQPRSLERFHLDDDTGPEQPYLGKM